MTMLSIIGTSHNQLLVPAGREDWGTVSTTVPSSTCDAVKPKRSNSRNNRNSRNNSRNNNKPRRLPHYIRLDDERVSFSLCELHSIPEDAPACEYQQVTKSVPRNPRRHRNRALNAEQFQEILTDITQRERLESTQFDESIAQK